jgi:hypothetical protein
LAAQSRMYTLAFLLIASEAVLEAFRDVAYVATSEDSLQAELLHIVNSCKTFTCHTSVIIPEFRYSAEWQSGMAYLDQASGACVTGTRPARS